MGDAKRIRVEPISGEDAARLTRAFHYSGKVVQNSQLHFGAFLDGRCGGALSFGPSTHKRAMLPLVRGTPWNGFLELNRMAFADWLPRNSESRCIRVALRLLAKAAPSVKWVVSFADATQCGDGTIYRAAGFLLTQIKPNDSLMRWRGQVVHEIALKTGRLKREFFASTGGKSSTVGLERLEGFMLRYICFLDLSWRERLAVPVIPYSAIAEAGASMYRGEKRGSAARQLATDQVEEGGATPTPALHSSE